MRMMRPLLLLLAFMCLYLPLAHGFVVMEAVVADSTDTDAPLISVGWQAAAKSLNTKSNAGIVSSTVSFSSNAATIGSNIAQSVSAAGALMVFGLYDDDLTQAVIESTAFSDANLVLFGPYTQSTGVRRWSDNVYFMTCDPMMELISLLNWVFSKGVGIVKWGNVGWMFLTGGVYNDLLSTLLTTQLLMLGLRKPVAYEQPATSAFSAANFNAFMAMNPTCLFLFGARGAHTTSFFTTLIQNAYVKDSSNSFYIMMPFALIYSTGTAYQKLYLQSANSVVGFGNLRYSSPIPGPTDSSRSAAASFQADIKAYDASLTQLASISGFLMYYGWIVMQQVYYMGNMYNTGGGLNRNAVKRNAFMQNRYNIQDIVLGNYGGECANAVRARELGAACFCNQGGHYAAIIRFSSVAASPNALSSGVSITGDGQYYFPNTPCYTNQNVSGSLKSLYGAVVAFQNDKPLLDVGTVMGLAVAEAAKGSYGQTTALVFSAPSAALTVATAADAGPAVLSQMHSTTLSVLFGPVAAPYTPDTMADYFFVEPIVSPPSLDRDPSKNVMYVSATLRQQIYVAASYLGTLVTQKAAGVAGGVHMRYRVDNETAYYEAVGQSLAFFGVPVTSAIGVGATVAFTDELPTTGYTFVFGLQPADIEPLRTFLTLNTNANIIISFDELTLYYSSFTAAFGTTLQSFMSRVLFATNMPSWTDSSASGTIFQKFVSNVAAASRTPAAMRAFVGAMAVNQLSSAGNSSPYALRDWAYKKGIVQVSTLTLGTYMEGCATGPVEASMRCGINYGAREISLWSYARVVTPTTSVVAAPQSLMVVYSPTVRVPAPITETTSTTKTPVQDTTTTSTTTTTTTLPPCHITSAPTLPPITTAAPTTTTTTTQAATHGKRSDAWKYVVIALLAILLIALILLLIRVAGSVLPCFGGEPMHSAPVDCDAPTTVVFVEIEKWSDVQRAVPSAAAECIAEYRNIVRRLVEQHDCYEGGSLNDAFMVVARNPMNALKFAGALQKKMELMQGPAVDAVDAAYADLGLSSGAVRGLRVRVGVHTDVVDIAYDVDTDHYEYRGAGCIAALRTERFAHGGQVLVTGSTCEALTEKQLAGVHAVSLGSQQFQEYEEPVPLFELVVLPHREFGGTQSRVVLLGACDAALSMCVEGDELREEDAAALAVATELVEMLYSPIPLKRRIDVLREECEVRGIRVPSHRRGVSLEGYAVALTNLLAQYMRWSSGGGAVRETKSAVGHPSEHSAGTEDSVNEKLRERPNVHLAVGQSTSTENSRRGAGVYSSS